MSLQYNVDNNWNGRRNEIFEINPTDHFLKMVDTFCMEVTEGKKSPFNFEQELLNQAKVMEAHRLSARTHNLEWLKEIT